VLLLLLLLLPQQFTPLQLLQSVQLPRAVTVSDIFMKWWHHQLQAATIRLAAAVNASGLFN
jgi:hypothetical protein